MKRKILEKAVLAAVFGIFTAGSAIAGANDGAIAKLEAAKNSYLAGVRMEAIATKNAVPENIATGPASAWLTKVDAREVNMAANRYEKKALESVSLDGKTYYVAGTSYAENMRLNPSTRFSKDPVTDNTVDKADATIYADASGRAYYFESQKSFAEFIGLASPETIYGYSEPK